MFIRRKNINKSDIISLKEEVKKGFGCYSIEKIEIGEN